MSAQVDGTVICRVCTMLSALATSWNLFDSQASTDGLCLAQLVALVGGIEVRQDEEGLPAWCCSQCQLDVGIAYRVRKLCQESDRKLREMLETAVVSESGTVCKMEVEEPVVGIPECEEDREQTGCSNATETDRPQLEENCSNSKQDNQPYPVHLAHIADQADSGNTEEKQKFKCSYCPKLLATQEAREFHEYGHQNPFAFKCTRCTELFANYNLYRAHLSIHRPPKDTIISCKACGFRFKHKSSLYKHMAKKCTSQKHKCASCPVSFACQYELSRHVKKAHQEIQVPLETVKTESDEKLIDEIVEQQSEDTFDDDAVFKIEVEEPVIRFPEASEEEVEQPKLVGLKVNVKEDNDGV